MNISLSNLRQTSNQSASAYLEAFKDRVDMIDAYGGFIRYSKAMIKTNLEAMGPIVDSLTSTTDQYEQVVNEAKEQ